MNRSKSLALLLAAALALAPAAWCESHEEEAESPPALLFIWTDHVRLADASAYEGALRAVMAKLAETEEGRKLRFLTLASPQTGFAAVTPLADMADLDRASQEFMAATQAVGGMEAWDEVSRYVSHGSGQLLALRLDLSYQPAEPRAAEAAGRFRWFEWWYVRPGMEEELEAVARKFAELAAEKGSDTGWRVYRAITGDDLPLYLVVTSATDIADYHANDARVRELMGEAGEKLFADGFACARRIEHSWAVVRPDLSMGI